MRVTSMVAGLALVLAACGGEKPADGATTSDGAAPAGTEAPAATATGATHDVDMTFENNEYKFVPAEFSVKPGDVIRFHNKLGGPHNVHYWADSIPAGAEAAISIDREMSPLVSELLTTEGEVVTVTLAGTAPTGAYHFTCDPHVAMGMHGVMTVAE